MVLWRFIESALRSRASSKAKGTSGAAQLVGRIQAAAAVLSRAILPNTILPYAILPCEILPHAILPHATLPCRAQPKEVMMLRAQPSAAPEAGVAPCRLG